VTSRRSATAASIQRELAAVADADVAAHLSRYFKAEPGGYGEGDVFLGVRVPQIRTVLRSHGPLPLPEIRTLLDSPVHEIRLAGLLALDGRFTQASAARSPDQAVRAECADLYLQAVRAARVDNWDLVDCSAEVVLGGYLFDRPRDVLFELAASPVVWQRRVAVLTTFGFIHRGDATTTLELAARLLQDPHDLIHKAVGWMLREVGKRVDLGLLTGFLDEHAGAMPRTMLAYATEHLTADQRAGYRNVPRVRPHDPR
jgi:3-methyladenine DNA glycosylase AlkD